MIGVGIVGLGVMGSTHLEIFGKRRDARVVAVADRDEGRRTGRVTAQGNIEGQSQGGFDFSSVRQYSDALDVIHDPDVDLVDICLPTPFHLPVAKLVLQAGKHLLIEKPLARTAAEADELTRLAESSTGLSFCAMCMRFWPGWDWLKLAVAEKRYGNVLAATFRRVAPFPGGAFCSDGDSCGGAILDLHVHDSDFINHLFGLPQAVTSRAYIKDSGHYDHVVTLYHYDQIPLVVAEGGWGMSNGFPFTMQYTVNFERATATYDLAQSSPLRLFTQEQGEQVIQIDSGMGYEREIDYFLNCIRENRPSCRVTFAEAADSVRLVEAEIRSVQTGETQRLSR